MHPLDSVHPLSWSNVSFTQITSASGQGVEKVMARLVEQLTEHRTKSTKERQRAQSIRAESGRAPQPPNQNQSVNAPFVKFERITLVQGF